VGLRLSAPRIHAVTAAVEPFEVDPAVSWKFGGPAAVNDQTTLVNRLRPDETFFQDCCKHAVHEAWANLQNVLTVSKTLHHLIWCAANYWFAGNRGASVKGFFKCV